MGRTSGLSLSSRQRSAVQRLLHHATTPSVALRATVILLSGAGQSASQIARTLRVSERMVRDCRRRFRSDGLDGLRDVPRSGRPPQATPRFVRLLLATVEKNPRRQGFVFTRWTAPRLASYLHKKTGIRLSPRGIAQVLRHHDFVWRKAKLTTRNKADEGEKKAGRMVAKSPPTGCSVA